MWRRLSRSERISGIKCTNYGCYCPKDLCFHEEQQIFALGGIDPYSSSVGLDALQLLSHEQLRPGHLHHHLFLVAAGRRILGTIQPGNSILATIRLAVVGYLWLYVLADHGRR